MRTHASLLKLDGERFAELEFVSYEGKLQELVAGELDKSVPYVCFP